MKKVVFFVFCFFVAVLMLPLNSAIADQSDSSPPSTKALTVVKEIPVGIDQGKLFTQLALLATTEELLIKKGFVMDSNFFMANEGAVVVNWRDDASHILKELITTLNNNSQDFNSPVFQITTMEGLTIKKDPILVNNLSFDNFPTVGAFQDTYIPICTLASLSQIPRMEDLGAYEKVSGFSIIYLNSFASFNTV